MNDAQLKPSARPSEAPPSDASAAWLKLVTGFLFSQDRVAGYVRHLAQWLSVWAAAKGYLGEGNFSLLNGALLNIAIILMSWHSGSKSEMAHQIAGIVRHVVTLVMAVVVFKGWLSNDQAHQLQEAIAGFILSSASSASAGEKFIPSGEE